MHICSGGILGGGDGPHQQKQVIALPPAMDPILPDIEDQSIIRAEEVKLVANRRQKLEEALKKGYATVYN
jgi:hypothetical protein